MPLWELAPRKTFTARVVQFCDDGASIVVFYLESHEMYVFVHPPVLSLLIRSAVVTLLNRTRSSGLRGYLRACTTIA